MRIKLRKDTALVKSYLTSPYINRAANIATFFLILDFMAFMNSIIGLKKKR